MILFGLELLATIFLVISGLAELGGSATIRSLAYIGLASSVFSMMPRVIGMILIAFAIVSLGIAIGIWMEKKSVRLVALVVAVITIILFIISYHFIGVLIDGVILFFLSRPNVKQYLK